MLLLLLVLSFFPSHQDDIYYVSHVNGKVWHPKSSRLVKIGDELNIKGSLRFSTINDQVAVISPSKGRFVIRKKEGLHTTSISDFLLEIEENLIPAKHQKILAGRSVINSIDDLRVYFGYLSETQDDRVTHLLLIDTVKIEMEGKEFSADPRKFFFLRLRFNDIVVNKKIAFTTFADVNNKSGLIIEKSLFSIDGKELNGHSAVISQLYYYDSVQKVSEKVADLRIHIVSESQLSEEIKVLHTHLKNFYRHESDGRLKVELAILSELFNNYGLANEIRIKKLIDKAVQLQ